MTADYSRRSLIAGTIAAAAGAPVLATTANGADGTAPAPSGATPSPRQWAWAQRELYAFVHFSMNTFTDKEWGYGDEDPKMFAPSGFDPDQIVAAAKRGGLRGLILTAKHHDGFCLWPTMLTEHCIRNSPYRGGRGDIVGEMAAACRRADMPFGLYLSPWDRNRADYGTPAYLAYYRAQLTELCTRYGSLFEVWFDGANGGDGWYGGAKETRKIDAPAYYDWPSIVALVHSLQPMACTFDPVGADIRWVGNEDGRAGDPCWPTMAARTPTDAERNSGVRGGSVWWPAETDVSIRPGWFYHPDEDGDVKSPTRLLEIYDQSVGRGTNLILNLPPTPHGVIAPPDLAALAAFGDALKASFAVDLARAAVPRASSERGRRFAAGRVIDGDAESYWSTTDADPAPTLVMELPPGTRFDLVRIREYLPLGVRVTRFAIDAADAGGAWREIAQHEGIGARRLIRLAAPIAPRRLRLRIVAGTACPAISELALFLAVAPRAVATPAVRTEKGLDRRGWRIAASSAPAAEAMLDGNSLTAWTSPAPARVVIDMGQVATIGAFYLTPTRHPIDGAGPPASFLLETSLDGDHWQTAAKGELSNIAYARATQRFRFGAAIDARWVRLSLPAAATADPQIAVAEFGVVAAER